NEEAVARAIAACPVPVVSAVGHETDFTIADFVADLRAPTPSAAAELVVSTREQIEEQIETASVKLGQLLRYRLLQSRRRLHDRGIDRAEALLQWEIGRGFQRVDDLDYRLRHAFRERLDVGRRRVLEAESALQAMDLRVRFSRTHRRLEAAEAAAARLLRERLVQKRARFDRLSAQLEQLSPLKVLERGYAIVQGEAGTVIKDAAEAPPPASIRIRLARGGLKAVVTDNKPA
ncbi:MAG TPA: exodeoxyribonuclease VII large subunit, partial [Bryobacteraceae bacterium]|nr:exodeoxyribonuclease VII large subunit [Bryobacteraceae bacterium]